MKKTLCVIMAAFLYMCGSTGIFAALAEETEADRMPAAFSGQKTFFLVPCAAAVPPCDKTESGTERQYLGLSPDGKTILYLNTDWVTVLVDPSENETEQRDEDSAEENKSENGASKENNETGSEFAVSVSRPGRKAKEKENPNEKAVRIIQFCLYRGGQMIPIRASSDSGDGDPYGKLVNLSAYSYGIPASEGISWSADGRYVTFSALQRNLMAATGGSDTGVPVIDTVSEEVWMADSYNDRNPFEENYGHVLLSKMSRDGAYVYYLAQTRENDIFEYQFCRRGTENGEKEILCRNPAGDRVDYDLYSTSDLFESADGSWILLGKNSGRAGSGRNTYTVLVRFVLSGETWRCEVRNTMIPMMTQPVRFSYSAESGYGLAVLVNLNTVSAREQASMEEKLTINAPYLASHRVSLVRFRPEENYLYDIWYLRRSGDSPAGVEMVPAETYLRYIQLLMLGSAPELPADFDAEEAYRNPDPKIHNVCISPDGQYAMLYVRFTDEQADRLYLLQLETMEVRPVGTPEDLVSINLAAAAVMGKSFAPRMIWNDDWTLVIEKEDGIIGFYRLAAQ